MSVVHYLSAVIAELEASIRPELQSAGARQALYGCQRVLLRAAEQLKTAALCEPDYQGRTEATQLVLEQFGLENLLTAGPQRDQARAASDRAIELQASGVASSDAEFLDLLREESQLLQQREAQTENYWRSLLTARGGHVADTTDIRSRLEQYLRRHNSNDGRVAELQWLSGGRTKQTALLTLEGFDGLPNSAVLRKEVTGVTLQTSLRDEYPLLQHLSAHSNSLRLPRPYLFEDDESVLGGRFALVSHLPGRMAGGAFSAHPSEALALGLAEQLGILHSLPVEPARHLFAASRQQQSKADFAAALEAMRIEWTTNARTPSVTAIAAFAWLRDNLQHAEGLTAIVHGDCGFHNVLVHEEGLGALLDWELAHLGHPAEDLGYIHSVIETMTTWPKFMAAYHAAGGLRVSTRAVHFFTVWKSLWLATIILRARQLFEDAPPASVHFAEAPSDQSPMMLTRLSRELIEAMTEEGQ
ncbi:phosphotransferase family protein [Steroidobacter sp.]|uniref:phosphotransferase family protein n=1 Tax=Steroidobacter sp. TaxID=1978227 RepID=UPI001A4BBFE9|nr:phosphotransferase family protein [Steroidobacter sp.]MBL8271568.1 phosphotransferase family protein [Steroidobacter sp.]